MPFVADKVYSSEESGIFLPDFCSVRTVFVTVLLAELLAFVLVLAPLSRAGFQWDYLQFQWLSDLAFTSLFVQWVVLLNVGVLCWLRPALRRLNSDVRVSVIAYLLILLVAAGVSEVAWWLTYDFIRYGEVGMNFNYPVVILEINFFMLIFCVVVFLVVYYGEWWAVDRLVIVLLGLFFIGFLLSQLVGLLSVKEHLRGEMLQHLLFLLRNLGITAIIAAIAMRYFYVQHYWRLNTEAFAHARIQALQARIRPHFLFNSMNAIASLIRCDPDLAEEAVVDLCELFRASFADSRRLITLGEEVELCERYLGIEGLRLDERLRVVVELNNVPLDALVPPLCLQPLLENAVYHGIQPLPEGGTIRVMGVFCDDWISLSIENPTVYGVSVHKGNQIAQQNIQQRLQLCFGAKAGLSVHREVDVYCVTVHIPYQSDSGRRCV